MNEFLWNLVLKLTSDFDIRPVTVVEYELKLMLRHVV